jgi:vacuolar-type H+-ATPase subunit E/Vma4
MDPAGLLQALAASAHEEAEALLNAARAQATALATQGVRRRASLRAKAKAEADAAFAAALDQAVRDARREAAAGALRVRGRFLDEVFRRVSALLAGAVQSPEYRAHLEGRLEEALSYTGGGSAVTVRCAPALLEPMRAFVHGRGRVEVDEALDDGFEVIAGNGTLRVDARLSTELQRRRPLFAVDLVREAGP